LDIGSGFTKCYDGQKILKSYYIIYNVMKQFIGFSVSFISTWYPRLCGIASFTENTAYALNLYEDDIRHIKIHPIDKDGLIYRFPAKKKHIIHQMDSSSWIDAAEMIIDRYRRNKVKKMKTFAILEHEYGLDGNGRDNNYNEVAKKLKEGGVPNIVVLHTILENPDDYQRDVIQQFGENCDKLVIITPSCKEVLKRVYGIEEKKIVHIPHGIPETHKRMTRRDAKEKLGLENRVVISTAGLISEGKGIEYGIKGFSKLLNIIKPSFREKLVYVVGGQTHPEIQKKYKGKDPYREKIHRIAKDEGLNPVVFTGDEKLNFPDSGVIFWNRYLTDNELVELIKASDIMLLPYTNPEQVSSGNLAYSIGLGTAVVSTKFRYARDIFSDEQGNPDGSGVLVDFRDENAIAEGLRKGFENHVEIEAKAYQKGVTMGWSVVGKQMVNLLYNVAMEPSEIESATIPFLD